MNVGVAADITGYRGSDRIEVLALLPPLKTGLRVLEIGCGEGGSTIAVRGAVEIWGVEPHQLSAQIASKVLDHGLVGTFEQFEADLPRAYFNLVMCNDVIEHMLDPEMFFSNIQKYTVPNAILVGFVPNVCYIKNLVDLVIHVDWKYTDSGILNRTHFRFFTLKSLQRTLERWNARRGCCRSMRPSPA